MSGKRVRTAGGETAAALVLWLCLAATSRAVEPEDLRRGLIATHGDGTRQAARLESTIALSFQAGEAAHPHLAADGGATIWQGYVNIVRGGPYRFRARLRGEFTLKIGGKQALAATVKGDKPAWVEGGEVRLDAGIHELTAEFKRLLGAAVVELRWQAPFFRPEPIPPEFLGHLQEQARTLARDAFLERGRFLAEELSCVRCHRPDDADRVGKGLAHRVGPDLSQVGKRINASWLYAWLGEPRSLRPATVMPEMFAPDEAGAVERYAVTKFLSSLGGPIAESKQRQNPKDLLASVARGQKVWGGVGCTVCHGLEKQEKPAMYPLPGLGGKTTPERLAEYLSNPLAIDPSGRMPHMQLNGQEANDLARFLCQPDKDKLPPPLPKAPDTAALAGAFGRVEPRAEERAAFAKRPAADQWIELGLRLVIAKGCNSCHTIAPGGKPFAEILADGLSEVGKRTDAGCLADDKAKRGTAPSFHLDKDDRDALRAFVRDGLKGAGSPAPAYAARVALQRFNCLGCHARDGEGGLTPEVTEELRRYERAENAESVQPPTLTGIGHKLRTTWLRTVLTGDWRARPWMGLRMPQFGEAQVGKLPEALAALEAAEVDDTVHQVPLSAAKIEAGRTLIGKNAFGCISCHDIAGVPNTGTRGPDLATTNQRVRYDWYLRWLEQPQRMQPGTRMPAVFTDGKSLVPAILGGDAGAQAEATWAYLSLGNSLPLPVGLEPPKGLILTVKDRPYLLRTFMPDAGSRAVAIGFAGGVAAAFDAHTCRLAYAWTGNFLDATPVWGDRGGNPAKVLGARLWAAPAGCPVGATTSAEPPDFAGRARDPAFGGPVPEGKLPDVPPLLHFEGYALDKAGMPTFRYRVQTGADAAMSVAERVEGLRSPAGSGVGRRFTLEVPAGQSAWLLVGECKRPPRLTDEEGHEMMFALKSGKLEPPGERYAFVLPQDGERVTVLTFPDRPAGASWYLQRVADGWQVLLHVPPADKAATVRIGLNVWVPYRDDPGLVKELLSGR